MFQFDMNLNVMVISECTQQYGVIHQSTTHIIDELIWSVASFEPSVANG